MIEKQRWDVDQAARSLGMPPWVLGGVDQNPRSTPEQRNTELLSFTFGPWMKRFEEALHADDDMFPDKGLFPFFESNELVRAELALRYAAYLQGRQAGWLSVNDIRKEENLPPIEGGDEYQTTPVGGAPNLQPGSGNAGSGEAPADPTAV
jgi:phage portal protein BeeE